MDWFDVLQSVISGIFVGLVVFGLDLVRAHRERKLSDFRIAANWEKSRTKVSLRSFYLFDANLSGFDLSDANLESANMQKAQLGATNLKKSNLRSVNLKGAQLIGVNFQNAVAHHANFSGTIIRGERKTVAKHIVDFSNAVLTASNFRRTKASDTLFRGANLKYTDFTGAIILRCDFTGADFSGSKWKKVKQVVDCTWKDVKGANSDNFPVYLLKEIQEQNAN